jgi:hypothetical protein
VLLFELITLKRPFDAESAAILVVKIATSKYDQRALDACSHPEPLKLLTSGTELLHPDASERCTLARCEQSLRLLGPVDAAVDLDDVDESDTELESASATRSLRLLASGPSIQSAGGGARS